jgi:hypothetical protein
MKVKYTERLDILFAPESATVALTDLGAIPSQRTGVKFEIPVQGAVRDRDGFRTAFQLALQGLRSKGVIFNVIPTPEARELIKAGKIDEKTHAAVKPVEVAKLKPSKVPQTT